LRTQKTAFAGEGSNYFAKRGYALFQKKAGQRRTSVTRITACSQQFVHTPKRIASSERVGHVDRDQALTHSGLGFVGGMHLCIAGVGI
jgi:hypothetical protein